MNMLVNIPGLQDGWPTSLQRPSLYHYLTHIPAFTDENNAFCELSVLFDGRTTLTVKLYNDDCLLPAMNFWKQQKVNLTGGKVYCICCDLVLLAA